MATTINRKVRNFTDFNLSFETNPFSKDILLKKNEDAVKASIKNLILTKNYERPFHPEIGSPVYALLFENFNPIMKNTLEKVIEELITKFEPRAQIISVDVTDNSDENSIDVQIDFRMQNIAKPITVLTTLKRVR